ncbi:MAG: YajQ family cyclic di-GMP-binding protein [Polyangiales bacterium]
MPSFDVVSKLDHHEVDNALTQTQKEVAQRFDFRDTDTSLEKTAEGIVIRANSDGRVSAALDVLREKMIKRKVDLKSLDPQAVEPAGGSTWRQVVKLKEGVAQEKAKDMVKAIKGTKLKVQASIQGDAVRITGKKKDDLQEAIAFLRGQDFELPLQFTNFRD